MNDIAIRVEGLSKQYRIGAVRERYKTLRDTLTDAFVSPFRRVGRLFSGHAMSVADLDATIWALKDACVEIKCGEVVGVIGRNGAGKSTFLKILSRITEPTVGFAEIRGRVGSLLEVGTGFHPELTGSENILLNGAILGMRRAEIESKFDDIVSFAELERFIGTPVKHYSSGMYMRLAFAVAAHLEPEIMLVDEVLAVGDERFQRKCLSKMQEVGRQGRTVLFVSHNMPAITRLCERAILLDEGKVVADGPAHQVVSTYLNSELGTTPTRDWPDPAKAPGGKVARLQAVRVRTDDGLVTDIVDIRRPFGIDMEYVVLQAGHVLSPYFEFFNEEGVQLFSTADLDPAWRRRPRAAGRYVSTAWIPGNLLAEGTLFVGVGLATMDPVVTQFEERDVVALQVVDTLDGDSARGDWAGRWGGVVRPLLEWSTQVVSNDSKVSVTRETGE